MNNPRINFFVNTLSEGRGIPNRVVSLASEMSRSGDGVSILTFNRSNRSLPETLTIKEPMFGRTRRLPYKTVEIHNALLNKIAERSLERAFKELKPDVVFVDYAPLDRFAVKLRKKAGYKLIYTYHGVADPDMYEGKERERRIAVRNAIHAEIKKADLVTAVSEYTKQELAKIGVNALVVPNGVDTSCFRPGLHLPNLHKDKPVLVYVGRYTEHKGVMNMLKAFQIARKSLNGAVLYMFARHESKQYVEQIQSFIRTSGLQDSVLMFRELSGEILPYIYCLGDVFVSGALDETFGMTFIEAAACGTPSVAFASKSIPEVVDHGRTGILCEPGNINALADGMIKLVSNPTLRAQYSKNAVEFVKKYEWKVIANQVRTILSSLS